MDSTQLLILGNGFDLHCGLKSSYNDFLMQAILDSTVKNYGILQLRDNVTGFWEGLLFEYYRVNRTKQYNWCNIEKIIKQTLWHICFGIEETQPVIRHGMWIKAVEIVRTRSVHIENKSYYDDNIKDYIMNYCIRFMSGISIQTIGNSLSLLLNELLKELHNFEKRFCKYLKSQLYNQQNNTINEMYIINAMNLLNRLVGFYDGDFYKISAFMRKEEKQVREKTDNKSELIYWKMFNVLSNDFMKLKTIHILSFNYTAVFDILDTISPCAYNNVHGKLCNHQCQDSCESSSIIFGIDDAIIQAQNECSALRLFSKTYRKMFTKSSPNNILPPNNGLPIEIKFYGHSLSEADYSYFQSIFDYYNLYSNSNISLSFYYANGYDQTDEIYQLFNIYGRTLLNQNQGKNLIHKLLLENRLKIVELSDNE